MAMTECEELNFSASAPFTIMNNDKNWRGIFATRT